MKKGTSLGVVIGVVVIFAIVVVGFNSAACLVSYSTSSKISSLFGQTAAQGPGVGLIRIEGVIMSGRPPSPRSDGTAYSEKIAEIIDRANKNKAVKAIVLRVDSPGGSVVGSNEIYHALLKVDKPIIVSMGEMAASGGYYVSCAADKIMVNPGTLTGSIGVIAEMPNVQGLMGKLGVEVNVIKSGKLKDEGSPFRPMTDEEKAVWQTIIDESYDQFVSIVATGRKLPEARVREIADGRVYTGLQAIKLGLADQEGNLPDAIKLAGEMGGLKGEPEIIELYTPPTFLESLLMSLPGSSSISLNLQDAVGIDLSRPTLQYLYMGH